MKRRLVIFTTVFAALAVFAALIVQTALFVRIYRNSLLNNLARTVAVLSDYVGTSPVTLVNLMEILGNERYGLYRITVVAPDGQVLADSKDPAATLIDHAMRPEIQEALRTGQGTDVRYSDSLGTEMLYAAHRLENGNILRIATPMEGTKEFVDEAIPWSLLVFGCVAGLASAVLISFAHRLFTGFDRFDESLERYLSSGMGSITMPPDLEIYPELEDAFSEIGSTVDSYIRQTRMETQKNVLILNGINEGLLIVDENLRVREINRAAAAIFHVPQLPLSIGASVLINDPSAIEVIEETFRTHQGASFDFKDEQTGRSYRGFTSFSDAPDLVSEWGGSAVLIIVGDITDSERAAEIRSGFAANVSHELKTPLTSIHGFAELIAHGLSADPISTRKHATRILDETERLMGLIDDILVLSGLEDVTITPTLKPVPLRAMVKEVREALEEQAEEKDIIIDISGAGSVTANPERIRQLILNLVDNAIKYSRQNGRIHVHIEERGNETILSVQDEGIGIPQRDQARVFERFFRARNAGGRSRPGTGLGLAIVKHITELYGGRITVNSSTGIGSTFTVHFPNAGGEDTTSNSE